MSYRYMRVIVFFDLPVITPEERRDYRMFRKFLIKNGFIMLQESVYAKLAPNTTVANSVMGNVRKNKPAKGLIQMLTITEKQFSKMEFVLGENSSNIVDSDNRLVIL